MQSGDFVGATPVFATQDLVMAVAWLGDATEVSLRVAMAACARHLA